MKTSELIKLLKRSKKCYLVEHRKAHDRWYSEITNKYFYVPRHGAKEIANGTAAAILRDAGIMEER